MDIGLDNVEKQFYLWKYFIEIQIDNFNILPLTLIKSQTEYFFEEIIPFSCNALYYSL